jgi:Xaa-Pro aminopeptidase
MKKNMLRKMTIVAYLLLFVFQNLSFAQRTGYSREEFMRRRKALLDKVQEGMVILFGDALPLPGSHFRQDNDFYYFTGVEDKNAILVMLAERGESHLFLPRLTPREEMMDGENLLKDEKAKEKLGFANIYDLSYFDEFIARNARYFAKTYLRLQARDNVDNDRGEVLLFNARKSRIHYNDQIPLDNYRILKLKERYPAFEWKDVTPYIDALRMIKSTEEIEVLRHNGTISAEAVKRAMMATKPGVYEYEIEAAAMHWILKNGAQGAAYPPIVGSGPNTCVLHYEKNSRKAEAAELVLMDFGASLDYLCMDISRTWPVSGKFTAEQRELYQLVLEVQKACIEAYRPGVTSEDVQKHVEEVLKKKGLDARGIRGGIGHFVGLAVHDVGPRGLPLQEGMVFAIEPGLYLPEKNIGIRIEDTVLITKDGCEVLTKDVPKEIDEIEKIVGKENGHGKDT